MKIPKFILLILILLSLSSYGQAKAGIIKNIRKNFLAINSDTTVQKISLEDEEFMELRQMAEER